MSLRPELEKIGGQNYVNPNCWLAKSVSASPVKRCRYCEMKFSECPASRYLILTLILIFLSLLIAFLIEGTISRAIILVLFFFIISYGYFFNKHTEKLVATNFTLKKAKESLEKAKEKLEEAKTVLEIKVKARTKELKELSEGLDRQVKEKTKELQERIDELERFHKMTIGRELKMTELKKEVARLKEEINKIKRK